MAMPHSIMVVLAGLSGGFNKTVPRIPVVLHATIRVCVIGQGDAMVYAAHSPCRRLCPQANLP